MTDRDIDRDIEFIPTDEVAEEEAEAAEDDAVHVHDLDEPKELMNVEADNFEAELLADDEAEELGLEADEAMAEEQELEAEEEAEEEFATEEHEEALDEIVHRHYGLGVGHEEEQP